MKGCPKIIKYCSEELRSAVLEMVPWCFSGLTFGMTTSWNPNSQGSIPLPGIRTSQWPGFCLITLWRPNFTCPYQSRPSKNSKVSRNSFKICRSIRIQRIPGNTFREARTAPHQSATTFLTRIYNPHPLFSGFGTSDAATNLEFFRGSS